MSAASPSPALSSRGQQPVAIHPKKSAPTAAEAEHAFRQARRTVFGHLVFIGLCCLLALVLRKLLHLPSIMVGAIIVIGLIVFANDVVRMFIRRHQLKRALRSAA